MLKFFDSLKNKFLFRFKNRTYAANILAGALDDSLEKMKLDMEKVALLILIMPRGGVIVADIIPSKLPYNCNFDIIIPRKLTASHNKEIAIGAFVTGGLVIVTSSMVQSASAGLATN